jgi:hypothetical protein
MKPIDAHETEAVVDVNGSVHVEHLPFAAGDRVRILILREAHPRHTRQEIHESRQIRHGFTGGVIRYDRPNDPVGVEDWEMLRDDGDQTSRTAE